MRGGTTPSLRTQTTTIAHSVLDLRTDPKVTPQAHHNGPSVKITTTGHDSGGRPFQQCMPLLQDGNQNQTESAHHYCSRTITNSTQNFFGYYFIAANLLKRSPTNRSIKETPSVQQSFTAKGSPWDRSVPLAQKQPRNQNTIPTPYLNPSKQRNQEGRSR